MTKRNPWLKFACPRSVNLVTEATIGKWFKKPGDAVAVDEPLVELETDKVTIEVPAPAAGVLGRHRRQGRRHGRGRRTARPDQGRRRRGRRRSSRRAAATPPASRSRRAAARSGCRPSRRAAKAPPADAPLAPSVRKLAAETGIDAASVRRHRQGRPRHQGRHAGGDRARRRAADAGGAARRRGPGRARRRRPTMPRAKSACA